MNLHKCDMCKNRHILCFNCMNHSNYKKSDFSHDEFIKRMAVVNFATEIIEDLEYEIKQEENILNLYENDTLPHERSCNKLTAYNVAIKIIKKCMNK